jgi:hypothetical protein
MTSRRAWAAVAAVSVVALGATTVFGVIAWRQRDALMSAPSAADVTGVSGTDFAGRVVFRNTAAGEGYGLVASVDVTDPAGARSVGDLACDRVDATAAEIVCLRNERGIVPSYSATVSSNTGETLGQWPLSGLPSRTRLSPDGTLVATTAFVTGHSYATIGFSTETVIRTAAGESLGNLEEWALVVDGSPSAPVERNFWGVTFVDDETFYATLSLTATGLATPGQTFLVRGDIAARTLTTVIEDVECPSLSPDGARIAFKLRTSDTGSGARWTPAIYDLASGTIAPLPEERNIDDQIEWLDDHTVLYGMPRSDRPGDTDVWRLPVDGSGRPSIFIEHAWSPSIVRGGTEGR